MKKIKQFGTSEIDIANDIAFFKDDQFFVTGSTDGAFTSNGFTNLGGSDAFISFFPGL